eukprot:2310934-Pyramimonas_sp.AAC.1
MVGGGVALPPFTVVGASPSPSGVPSDMSAPGTPCVSWWQSGPTDTPGAAAGLGGASLEAAGS